MEKKGLVSIKAIIVGFLSDFVAYTVFTILLSFLAVIILAGKGYEGEALEKMLLTVVKETPYRLFSLVAGLGFTMMGGYIAGRLAKSGELFHSAAVGLLNIVFGLFFISMHFTWYNLLAFILILPAALLGGNFARERRLNVKAQSPDIPRE